MHNLRHKTNSSIKIIIITQFGHENVNGCRIAKKKLLITRWEWVTGSWWKGQLTREPGTAGQVLAWCHWFVFENCIFLPILCFGCLLSSGPIVAFPQLWLLQVWPKWAWQSEIWPQIPEIKQVGQRAEQQIFLDVLTAQRFTISRSFMIHNSYPTVWYSYAITHWQDWHCPDFSWPQFTLWYKN